MLNFEAKTKVNAFVGGRQAPGYVAIFAVNISCWGINRIVSFSSTQSWQCHALAGVCVSVIIYCFIILFTVVFFIAFLPVLHQHTCISTKFLSFVALSKKFYKVKNDFINYKYCFGERDLMKLYKKANNIQ